MRLFIALGAALLASTSANAAVNLVNNGSFETNIAAAGSTFLATGNTTALPGWRVLSRGVNVVDDTIASLGWLASDGSQSVELTTTRGNGGILQRISGFTSGYRYRLTFDVSANPYNTATRPKAAKVIYSTSGSPAQQYIYTLNNVNTATSMMYDTVIYDFVAVSTIQNLQFRGAVGGKFGPVIDNVSVTVVPEASTWAMMILGLGLVGFSSRRRIRGAVSA